MAIWQYAAHLVPRRVLLAVCPDLTRPITEDQFNDTDWWGSHSPAAGFLDPVAALLPEGRSWATDTRQFGSLDSHCMEVSHLHGRVDDVFARVDLRSPMPGLLRAFNAMARGCDGWWLEASGDGRIPVEPTDEALLHRMRSSPAAQFVIDPYGFLAKLPPQG